VGETDTPNRLDVAWVANAVDTAATIFGFAFGLMLEKF
jgi:hypothetical protein